MAIQGLKLRVRASRSTAQLEMRLVASRLWRISAKWEISDHQDVVCIEVVAKLLGGDEYSVE
jgi:hypothetical protein